MNYVRRSIRQADAHSVGGLQDRLWIAALLLLVFLLGCFEMGNGDIWWHLRTGQLIWERGEVPRHDWYTYTNPEAEWIDLHWGFQLAAAGLWELGGTAALIVAKSAVGVATIGVCLLIGRRNEPKWQTVGIWLAPVLVFAGRYFVRPEILSLLLLSLTLAVLFHSKDRPRLLWFLPLIQLVWVNVQGLFVLQYVVLGCFLLDALIRYRFESPAAPVSSRCGLSWRRWAGVLVATFVASLMNPYGLKGATFPLVLLGRVRGPERDFFHQFSSELAGTDIYVNELVGKFRDGQTSLLGMVTDPSFTLLVLLFFGGLLSFLLLSFRGRWSLYRILLFSAFAYLTWQMTRNSVFFSLVAGVVIRMNIGELVETSVLRGGHSRREKKPAAPNFSSTLTRNLVAACLILLVLSVPTNLYAKLRPSLIPRRFSFGQSKWYGHDAARFLKNLDLPRTIYAYTLGQATVCIYHLAPEKRVFADARLEVNKKETLARYIEILEDLTTSGLQGEEKLRGPPHGPESELPALFIDNLTLARISMTEPGSISSLLEDGRWRCVFCELEVIEDVLQGASIFIDRKTADQLGLAADPDVDKLRK